MIDRKLESISSAAVLVTNKSCVHVMCLNWLFCIRKQREKFGM